MNNVHHKIMGYAVFQLWTEIWEQIREQIRKQIREQIWDQVQRFVYEECDE